mmetsp:Transcript_47152/g.156292  ORF Transcript_47152/g.156292 Transcript_47152/m.156292 type:complete len:167 (+) Transcript_47152:124-624(+)
MRCLPRHPSLVGLEGLVGHKGRYYLALEYCRGGEVFQEVEKHGLLSEDRAARLMSGAVAAIKHMHSHRVAHRDLKLENLLLADVGGDDVKVCDLGLALHVQDGARATKVCGTKSYTAPEILAHHAGPSHPGYDRSRPTSTPSACAFSPWWPASSRLRWRGAQTGGS